MKLHASEGAALPRIPVARAQGVWLRDHGGRYHLNAISSWWVNLFGHNHPAIRTALIDQLHTLDHVMLAGFSHGPVVELSERLAALTGLGHAFNGSDGASATENVKVIRTELAFGDAKEQCHRFEEGSLPTSAGNAVQRYLGFPQFPGRFA